MFDDPQLVERFAEACIYTAGASFAVVTYVGLKYISEIRKADFETRAERTRALRELMDSDGFKDYTQKRKELAESMEARSRGIMEIDEILESSLGNFKPDQI